MNCDFEVMLSDISEDKVLTLEVGVGMNGDPIFRVSIFNGKRWGEARYRDFRSAYTTYKLLKRVI